MGAWGEGVWDNDSALDELSTICEGLIEKARSLIETAEDAVEFQVVVALIDAIAALSENARSHAGLVNVAKVEQLQTAAMSKWMSLVPEHNLEPAAELGWKKDIEAVFARLRHAIIQGGAS